MFCVPAASQQHILPARRHSCPSSVLFWRRQSGTSCHGAEPAAWLHHAHSKQRTPNLSWLFLILAWDVGDSFCVMWWDEITLFFGGGAYRNHKTEVMQITEVLRQCDRIRTIVWGGVGQDTTEGMIPGNPVLCLS